METEQVRTQAADRMHSWVQVDRIKAGEAEKAEKDSRVE